MAGMRLKMQGDMMSIAEDGRDDGLLVPMLIEQMAALLFHSHGSFLHMHIHMCIVV